ncbi:hypothetical protein TPHA_0B01370 [Tetrapisispora phaffii CBS 4417]|uniref:PH domain-containing protein n=1 Tax=Tetrapisispora phaffii (strain ATCC 24235 / CBS 4417 / NBRC 1672 / NRRL Y-8282 / UCD 70-5) TaxID=1071381 RepID=G8BP79_TETPH|nr:hypothetical protein TPHA_0B01370 [Tetrapisispora phaffii CBS 4417]CCE61810.1 hypothetical protein TPHA_0B01370 [Tetrapisispora phaffii CBS 4417]
MDANDVTDAMDSLLKEIDNEMENTIDELSFSTVNNELNMHEFSMPLNEIGDDTMDMLVKHNTLSNIKNVLIDVNDGDDKTSTFESKKPMVLVYTNNKRKSISFEDEIEELEIQNNDESSEELLIDMSVDNSSKLPFINTVDINQFASKKDNANATLNEEVNKVLIDTSLDDSEISQLNTTIENDQISLVAGSLSQIYNDENKTYDKDQRVNNQVFSAELNSKGHEDNSNVGNNNIRTEQIDNESENEKSELDKDITEAAADFEPIMEAHTKETEVQEVSSIKGIQDASSLSSESIGDLDIATIPKDELELKDMNLDKSLNIQDEELENLSEQEDSINEPESMDENLELPSESNKIETREMQDSEAVPRINDVTEQNSSIILEKDNGVLKAENKADLISQKSVSDHELESNIDNNQTSIDYGTAIEGKLTDIESNINPIESKPGLKQGTDEEILDSNMSDVNADINSSESEFILKEKSTSTASIARTSTLTKDEEIRGSVESEKPTIKETRMLNNYGIAAETSNLVDEPEITIDEGKPSSTKTSNESNPNISYNEESHENIISKLPELPKIEKMFVEDTFTDLFETSNTSVDMDNVISSNDYLSIWHLQEDTLKVKPSPATDANSQFSSRTPSSGSSVQSSAASRQSSSTFKYKPRLVSRSRIYNPESRQSSFKLEEEMFIANLSGSLDPVRRKVSNSRVLQNKMKQNRKSYDTSHSRALSYSDVETFKTANETANDVLHYDNLLPGAFVNEYTTNNSEHLIFEESITPNKINDTYMVLGNSFDFLPAILDEKINDGDDSNNSDSNSVYQSSLLDVYEMNKTSNNKYGLWESEYDIKSQISHDHKSLSSEMLSKILSTASNRVVSQVTTEKTVKRALENNIHVNHGINTFGIDVDVSGEQTETLSIDEDEINHILEARTVSVAELKAASGKPTNSNDILTSMHIGSPFKVIKTGKFQSFNEVQNKPDLHILTEKLKHVEQDNEKIQEPLQLEKPKDIELVDNSPGRHPKEAVQQKAQLSDLGSAYITLKDISVLNLPGIKHHQATYCIEFDNGINVIKTKWQEMSVTGKMQLSENFESIVKQLGTNIILTLKLKYKKPEFEIAEVTQKVPVNKKSLFGKKSYTYEKKYIQRPTKVHDEWDSLVATDGSYGKAEIKIDEELLEKVKFSRHILSFDLINEWSKKASKAHNSSANATRLPAYKVGKISLDICYLERVDNLEKFPTSLEKCNKIVSKYQEQQLITKEGYLLQEGGDVANVLTRRYFKLRGSSLIGYHVASMQPVVTINLLNVKSILNGNESVTNGNGQHDKGDEANIKRNFTDQILFSGSIQIVFNDDEVINLNTDTSSVDKDDWFMKFQRAIELNICHQPWVKKYYQKNYEQK